MLGRLAGVVASVLLLWLLLVLVVVVAVAVVVVLAQRSLRSRARLLDLVQYAPSEQLGHVTPLGAGPTAAAASAPASPPSAPPLALLITAVAPLLFFFDQLSEAGLRNLLLIAMLGWFGTAVIR